MTLGALMQSDVKRLLDDHGYDLTLRRATRAAYDTSAGSAALSSNADETVRGVLLDYNDRDIDGTLVQRGDRKAVIATVYAGEAITKAPQVDDEIRGEGDAVRVVDARTIKSGATVVAYVCQVRG